MTAIVVSVLCAQGQFVEAFGGTLTDYGYAVVQTADGGYALAGGTRSFGAGQEDVFLVKTDDSGNVQWARTIGGSNYDRAQAVVQAADGDYVVGGRTRSYGNGSYDAFIFKLDAAGNIQWALTVGSFNYDETRALIRTSDGGYAAVIYTASYGAGVYDALLVKLDGAGALQWARTVGGADYDDAVSLVQTADGGYALGGVTYSYGAGWSDFFLVKLNSAGNLQWARTAGGTGYDEAFSLVQTADGGYTLAGWTNSYGAGGYDAMLTRFDSVGNLQWARTLGGADDDKALSLVAIPGGGYVTVGYTFSFGAGIDDALMFGMGSAGNLQWARTVGGISNDEALYHVRAIDNGFAIAGYTFSFGAGSADVLFIKTDAAGITCTGSASSPTVTSPSPSVATPSPTVMSLLPAVTNPNPTVMSPAIADTMVCEPVGVGIISDGAEGCAFTVRLVRGGLSISAAVPTSVTLYSADGRLVRKLTVSGTARVALSPGVYVLRDENGRVLKAAVAR